MLNELYTLSESLKRSRIKVSNEHKDLKKNRKTSGFILGIGENGLVETIEFVGKEKVENYWKIDGGDNLSSFPSFNITEPIYQISDNIKEQVTALEKLKKEEILKRIGLLEEIAENADLICSANMQNRLNKNLKVFPEKLRSLFADSPADFQVLPELLNRLLEANFTYESFLESISTTALKIGREGRLSAEGSLTLQDLFIGKWDKKNKKFVSSIVAILETTGSFDYKKSINIEAVKNFVNEQLNQKMSGKSFTKSGKDSKIVSSIDSFTGKESEIQTRFPQVNLPIISRTILMSMTSESQNQIKYGLKESETFQVSKETTQRILNSLYFLTDENRNGKSWRDIPSDMAIKKQKAKKDLLLVYLQDKPESESPFADFFAGNDEQVNNEAMFETSASKVCSALDGNPAINPDSLLRVIILTSLDEGRTQVSMNESYSVENIIESAGNWKRAGNNIPKILIPIKSSTNNKIELFSPKCPYPASLLKNLRTQWKRKHDKKDEDNWFNKVKLRQIFDIFLETSQRCEPTAKRLLNLALETNRTLLLTLGNNLHCGKWDGFEDKARLFSLNSISALGILLYKIGNFKEDYMKNAPYNIGRLLSLADQLHALYCNDVRDKSLPPQLFGNALMNTALQQPVKALALFGQRFLPYQAWANTVNSGENVGLAKYFLKEIGKVSQTIHDAGNVPTSLNDAERAEMILGYLASNKQNENQN